MATFTINTAKSRVEGFPPSNPRKIIVGIIALDTEGGAVGDIPASLFGLSVIEEVLNPLVISTDDKVEIATPSYDGTSLLLKNAGTVAPADVTTAGTYAITVKGY